MQQHLDYLFLQPIQPNVARNKNIYREVTQIKRDLRLHVMQRKDLT